MKFADALCALRASLNLTQPEFGKLVGKSAVSVAHYEIGAGRPDAASTALLRRAALKAGRLDLADVFAEAIPGVADGLLVPRWKAQKYRRKKSISAITAKG